MRKMIGAVLCVVAFVGCGGPLESDGTEVGTAQQGLGDRGSVAGPLETRPQLNPDILLNPQEAVVRAPAFQDLQHVTDPLHANPRH